MKKGDIVVCTNDVFFKEYNGFDGDAITKWKQYEVLGNSIRYGRMTITICDDRGDILDYRENRFRLLSEIREEKLNELGL